MRQARFSRVPPGRGEDVRVGPRRNGLSRFSDTNSAGYRGASGGGSIKHPRPPCHARANRSVRRRRTAQGPNRRAWGRPTRQTEANGNRGNTAEVQAGGRLVRGGGGYRSIGTGTKGVTPVHMLLWIKRRLLHFRLRICWQRGHRLCVGSDPYCWTCYLERSLEE